MSDHRIPPSGPKEITWNEIAPADHLLHVYEDEASFINSLEGFVSCGLKRGEAVILIATPGHRRILESRLDALGIDLVDALERDQYIPVDAEELLSSFMFRGWPNDEMFKRALAPLLSRAGRNGRRVRKFGEMASMLLAEGYQGAAVHLENLWHQLAGSGNISQYCAYPRSVFPQNGEQLFRDIFDAHSRVLA